MKDQSTARVYAQSFLELGKEKDTDLAKEFTSFTEAINASNDFENLLFLDVFTLEEKLAVFGDVAKKLDLSSLTVNAITYLINEKRINLFPLIFKEMIVIDDHDKGFLRGTIEGSTDSISDDYKNKFTALLKERLGKEPILNYKKNTDISAGYRVTVDDLQLDASIDNQLKEFKQSIIGE